MSRFDAVVIGAGMSGLGAGIRLAHFGKKVCVVEKHALWGGLNSFYKKGGRSFDVGLHAMTNFAPRGAPGPLTRLCRQLRLDREELALRPQIVSEIRFPGVTLRFSNDPALLMAEVAQAFPESADAFRRLFEEMRSYDEAIASPDAGSTRARLAARLPTPLLVDMILCPVLFYGSATEDDMPWHSFAILFKAIFVEGLCRPEGGIRRLLDVLKREYLARGGELRLRTAVERMEPLRSGGVRIELAGGETWEAAKVLSSAGRVETARLLGREPDVGIGRLSFVETLFCLDRPAREAGWEASAIFFSKRERFRYRRPDGLVDTGSGIVCCPENFSGQAPFPEGVVRVTSLARYDAWRSLDPREYDLAKEDFVLAQLDAMAGLGPDFRRHIVYRDAFTPLTIERFTSHAGGAVYGAADKALDGETGVRDVHLCGTDQGYLGIVGALLSGVLMANRHVLAAPSGPDGFRGEAGVWHTH